MHTEFYKMITAVSCRCRHRRCFCSLVSMSTSPLLLQPRVDVDIAAATAASCRCRHRCLSPASMSSSLPQPRVDVQGVYRYEGPCSHIWFITNNYASTSYFANHKIPYILYN